MSQLAIPLDTCCQNILVMLAKASAPMTSLQIADELAVTGRVVHYRLPRVEQWLDLRGVRLVKKPGEGLSIGADDTKRQELLRELSGMVIDQVYLTPTERIELMILSFLFSDRPLIVKQFEQQLRVSRTTVLKDLEAVEAWLAPRHLALRRRPNLGSQVEGGEAEWRVAIAEAVLESVGDAFPDCYGDVLTITTNGYKKTVTAFKRQLAAFLIPLDLSFFDNLVSRVAETHTLTLRETAHWLLVMYLAAMVFRLRYRPAATRIPREASAPNGQHSPDMAAQFSAAIHKRYQVRLTVHDMAELAEMIHRSQEKHAEFDSHEFSMSGLQERQQINRDFDPEIMAIVEHLLSRASIYLHPYLWVDRELILNLANHLTHLYKYPHARLPMKNPLLAELKKEYPYVYRIAEECSSIISQSGRLALEEGEVGYIAMYLAAGLERLCIPQHSKRRVVVVCNAGGATAWLLVSRLRSEFPDMEIVGVVSSRELDRKKALLDCNLMITTIPIDVKAVPTVQVSPLLNRDDIHRIRDMTSSQPIPPLIGSKTTPLSGDQVRLSDLLVTKTIRLRAEAATWEEVVEKAAAPLLETKAIEPRYVAAMKDVIKRCGPYMVIWPGVALLHARPDEGVNCLSMSLMTLKNPVPFGATETDPVSIAIVLGAVNNNSHLNALYELNRLMLKPAVIDNLRHAATAQQVHSLISHASPQAD